MCGTNHRRRRVLVNQDYQSSEFQENSPVKYQNEVKLVVDSNFTHCFSCNFSKNIKKAKYCQQCGNELQACPISKMKFSLNQEFVQCNSCKWRFHRSHLDNWMLKNRSCPICNGPPENMIVEKVGNNSP